MHVHANRSHFQCGANRWRRLTAASARTSVQEKQKSTETGCPDEVVVCLWHSAVSDCGHKEKALSVQVGCALLAVSGRFIDRFDHSFGFSTLLRVPDCKINQ